MTTKIRITSLVYPSVGHIGPMTRRSYGRKLTSEQVRLVWDSQHPYSMRHQLPVTSGAVYCILNRKTYRDITKDWPERSAA